MYSSKLLCWLGANRLRACPSSSRMGLLTIARLASQPAPSTEADHHFHTSPCRYLDGSKRTALFRLPNGNRPIKGTCIFVHGCKHDPESWFYKSANCPKCTGAPARGRQLGGTRALVALSPSISCALADISAGGCSPPVTRTALLHPSPLCRPARGGVSHQAVPRTRLCCAGAEEPGSRVPLPLLLVIGHHSE